MLFPTSVQLLSSSDHRQPFQHSLVVAHNNCCLFHIASFHIRVSEAVITPLIEFSASHLVHFNALQTFVWCLISHYTISSSHFCTCVLYYQNSPCMYLDCLRYYVHPSTPKPRFPSIIVWCFSCALFKCK